MVSARIVENGEEVESFTSYCYPGTLPGCAFSFNRHGMVFSCDGLYTTSVVEKTPNGIFLNRSVIKAKNVDEAIQLLKNPGFGVAYGFTVNIADIKDPSTMWSIEIGPQAGETKMHVHTLKEETDSSKPCHYIHCNNIEHLKDIAELPTLMASPRRRLKTHQMDAPRTKEGVLNILGDYSDQEYPIYRTPRLTDGGITVFTAVVNVLENKCEIYRDNPAKPGQLPLFHMQIKDGSN